MLAHGFNNIIIYMYAQNLFKHKLHTKLRNVSWYSTFGL